MKNEMTLMANRQAAQMGAQVYRQVMEETDRPAELQEQFLMKLLDDNKDTEYGRKHGFADIHSIKEYQEKVPVITYDNIASDMERMLAGEKNVLTAYAFDHMNTTAGTTGKSKLVPLTKEQQDVFAKYNYAYNNGLFAEYLDESYMEGRTFTPIDGSYKKADSGITIGCASAKAAEFIGGMEALDQQMRIMFTSPSEAMEESKGTDSKYIHVRFAMADKDMTGITVGFLSFLVQMFHYIELNYEVLINDIEKGIISDEIEMERDIKERLLKKIEPMPERAAELREIFKDGSHIQFVPLVWPNLKHITGVGGDGFAIYDKTIKEKYTGGKIPHIYSGITSSEGLWSFPRGLNNTDGILAAGSAFMEFLPVEADNDFTQIKTMDQLEVGGVYELIITNLCGMYRYRMSDAVKVTRFENKTPCVEFMYRVNRTINIGGEKLTEDAINLAVDRLARENNLDIVDFNVFADKWQVPGQHQFLFEFPEGYPEVNLESLREELLKKLNEANERMMPNYEKGNFALPKIFRLQPETNTLYRETQIFKGKPAAQLKPVRIIINEAQETFFFTLRDKQ